MTFKFYDLDGTASIGIRVLLLPSVQKVYGNLSGIYYKEFLTQRKPILLAPREA